MDFIIDFVLHIDRYMIDIVQNYHTWTYAILFLVIFCETGLVVTPFLPGDFSVVCCRCHYRFTGYAVGNTYIGTCRLFWQQYWGIRAII